jgi:hypothetical protein
MIKITPAQTKPYSTQPISFVFVMLIPRPSTIAFTFQCLNADKKYIPVDAAGFTAASAKDLAAMAAQPAQAGDTFTQDQHRRALAFVTTNLGLTGASIE